MSVPIHVRLSDGTVDYWTSVPGQTQGISYLDFPTGLNSSLTLYIDAHNPLTFELEESDEHTLPIIEVNTGFPDFLSGNPIPASTVENWMGQLGNSAVASACGWLFDSQTITDYSIEYGLPEYEVENRFNSLESQLKQALSPVWRGWVAPAYGIQSRYAIRVGSGHPMLGDVQGALNSFPQAINAGVTGLLAPGQDWEDILSQIVDVDVNTGAIAELVLDGIPSILQTGEFPTIAPDKVLLNHAGIRLPAGIVGQYTSVEASLGAGVYNITPEKLEGSYIDGSAGFRFRLPVGIIIELGAGMGKVEGQDPSQGAFIQAYGEY